MTHEYFYSAILQTVQIEKNAHSIVYLQRMTRCYYESFNSNGNKVQIYGKCFHRFASISAPASKLIID